jgi:YVTN family beta-propeller protein
VEFRVLGDLEVRRDGEAVPVGPHQQRAVLAVLVLHAGELVPSERLIDELWGEHPPATAAKTLQVYISRLRRALTDGTKPSAEPIVTRERGYTLQVGSEQIDAQVFAALLEQGRRAFAAGDVERAEDRFSEALTLWRGPPLAEFALDGFARDEIARLEELRLEALETHVACELQLGRDAAVVAELERLTAQHPMRERLRAWHMLALYRCGRQSDALAVYRRTRDLLVGELGIEPGPELRELHQQILRHDPVLRKTTAREPRNAEVTDKRARGRVRRRRRLGVVAAAVAVVAGVGGAIALVARSIPAPGPARVPADAVAVIDPRGGRVVAEPATGASPAQVVAGRSAVWVTNADAGSVTRIDRATHAVRDTVPVGGTPAGMALAAGAVWVAESARGIVARISPETDTVVQPIPVGTDPTAVAAAGGFVWVANSGARSITRIDPVTGVPSRPIDVGAPPTDLAGGAGALWVTSARARTLSRLDQRTGAVEAVTDVGGGASGLAVTGRSVWVANELEGTVSRVDAETGQLLATIPVGDGPRAIAPASGGVWVTDQFGGTVDRIDARKDRVVARLAVGNRPTGLAMVDGKLWVGVRASDAAHRGGMLRIPATSGVDSIDPAVAYRPLSVPIVGMTNDGLTAYQRVGGSDGAQLVPDLAVALPTATDHGRTYRFVLRRGIRYSNGAEVRATDVRASFERMFRIRESPGHDFYAQIVGARRCIRIPRACDLSRGISAGPGSSVTFHLTNPDPDFLDKLALDFAFVLPASTPARGAGTRPVPATGPYMITQYRPGHELRLARNPRFREWSQAAQPDGFPDAIAFRLDIKQENAVTQVERGRADDFAGAKDNMPPDRVRELLTRYASRIHPGSLSDVMALFLNTRVPPFNDARVRRAVSLAVDRRAALRLAGGPAVGTSTCQILPPNFPGYVRYCPHPAPRLAAARRLVRESGTAEMRVTVWANGPFPDVMRYAASVLQALGYRARVKLHGDFDRINDPRARVQAGPIIWIADYPAPSDFLAKTLSCAAFSRDPARNENISGFCSPRIDADMRRAAAAQASDPDRADRLWAAVDRKLVDAAPWVPLFNLRGLELVSQRVGNYQFNPAYGSLLDQLWVR